MGTGQIAGMNYRFDGNTIDFFGARGTTFGEQWGVNAFGGETWVQVDPGSIMDRVRGCIEGDVEAGNADKIAQLQLGAQQAVVFFLEGMLTRDHLKAAIEGPAFIDIPGVEIEGRTLTVRITAEFEPEVATADDKGDIL